MVAVGRRVVPLIHQLRAVATGRAQAAGDVGRTESERSARTLRHAERKASTVHICSSYIDINSSLSLLCKDSSNIETVSS